MPVARELSLTYGSVTLGGSTARQITGWYIEEQDYETSAFECEFITSAASEAAFKSELDTLRAEFRKPRLDLVVSLGSQEILSLKHSTNTGFDAEPRILKDGDPADTGRSRHFRIRIEFGRPADNVSTDFRRWSNVNVEYSPERQRTVTVQGVYTANSTDGTTGSFAQYRAQITTYLNTVTAAIDAAATWEVIGEPQVQRNETDKVVTFTIVAKEILHNQRTGTLNDLDIVDPEMEIVVEATAPGDSTGGGFSFAGVGGGGNLNFGPRGNTSRGTGTATMDPAGGGNVGQTVTMTRPIRVLVSYRCGINKERTKALTTKWSTVIRPFLIAEARRVVGRGLTLMREAPGFDDYRNRISATMEFLAFASRTVIEQKITVRDRTSFGKVLIPVTSKNPYDYYETPGPALRQRVCKIDYSEVVTGAANPDEILNKLVTEVAGSVTGLQPASDWMPVSNDPAVAVLRKGLVGGKIEDIAEVSIERVAQRRNKKAPSIANAGGVTGANLTV